MKAKHWNFFYFLWLAAVPWLTTACGDDSDPEDLIPEEYTSILSLKQAGSETLNLSDDQTDPYLMDLTVLKGGKRPGDPAVACVDVFSEEELAAYNQTYGTQYQLLPATCYSLDNTEFTLGSEAAETGKQVALRIDRQAVMTTIKAFWEAHPEEASPYFLPVRLSSSKNTVLAEKQDLIFFFNYAKPLPPEPVKPEWYVETFLASDQGNPFSGPRNLVVKDGKLYVLDQQETVKEVDLATKAVSVFYDLRNEPVVQKAFSLACGKNGTFYLGAQNGAWELSAEKTLRQLAGGEIHDVCERPASQELYYINGGESSIHLLDQQSNPSVSEGYEWWSEGQMIWNPTGEQVYIAIQGGKNQIDRFTYNPESKRFDKKEAALYKNESLLIHPKQMAFDSKGNLYVVSKESQVVVKITPEGEIIRLAGIAGQKGNADGKALEATFHTPYGIALVETDDPDHPTLYVGDTGNGAIRRIVYESRSEE